MELQMAKPFCGEPSYHGSSEGNYKDFVGNPEEGGGRWYFTRKEIEENSPSRRDGVNLKRESYLRKSYCTFIQDLGMRLKVPQLTIATAVIFCHRFYLRQSHVANDRRTIATVCMFLAGKVEETPRSLKDVIFVSYQILHKKDKEAAVQRIKHDKELYEQQKELILLGERVVLGTLGFDLNVHHPYKPLILALKKFDVENALVRVAWNFVNDGLRTSISLQYKAPQIAAGAIYLAAKFLKVELPFDIEKVLVQEFDITQRQLADMSNQILELYESKMPPSQPSEVSSITDCKGNNMNETRHHIREPMPCQTYSAETSPRSETTNIAATHESNDTSQISQPSEISTACKVDSMDDIRHHEQETMPSQSNSGETLARVELTDIAVMDKSIGRNQPSEISAACKVDIKDDICHHDQVSFLSQSNSGETLARAELTDIASMDKSIGRNLPKNDVTVVELPKAKKLNTEKLRAAFEQRKARRDITRKMEDSMDEIERELEDVEVPTGNKKIKCERKQSELRPANVTEQEDSHRVECLSVAGDGFDTVEGGEVEAPDDAKVGSYQSPSPSTRKRKALSSPLDK